MKFQKYMKEGFTSRSLIDEIPDEWVSKKKLKVGDRKKMNAGITRILKPTYFKSIPLDEIFKVLEKNGIVVIQEDQTEWSGLLVGGVRRTEMVNFNLGWKDDYKTEHGSKRYMAIPNAVLVMTYYKMQSGKYEVIAYVS